MKLTLFSIIILTLLVGCIGENGPTQSSVMPYPAFLDKLQSKYTIINATEWDNPQDGILIRHDIDFSPIMALEMAKAEHERGIITMYCVPFESAWNPLHYKSTRILKEIYSYGHVPCLHYNLLEFEVNGNSTNAFFLMKELLEEMIGQEVHWARTHGIPYYLGDIPDIPFKTTNDRDYLQISDANNQIHGSLPIKEGVYELTIHPVWWNKNNPKDLDKLFE